MFPSQERVQSGLHAWRSCRCPTIVGSEMNDLEFRHAIFTVIAETGERPPRAAMEGWLGSGAGVDEALQRLHDAHSIVLDTDGSILMALPFSAVPTDHRVVSGDRSWWANCAWDSLAIAAALNVDASIEATWLDTGAPVDLAIVDGQPTSTDGFVHFSIPARHWWDDVVET